MRLAVRSPSRIHWTFQKGAIGQCWKLRQTIGFDCWQNYTPLLSFDDDGNPCGPGIDARDWPTVRPEVRLGLNLGFGQIAGNYGTVIVSPMYGGDRWIGCITVDVPWGDHYQTLWRHSVRKALSDAASTISQHVLKIGST